MWRYTQSTGRLDDPHGTPVATGYAGYGVGKNNPAMQDVPNTGPLPCGRYTIGPPRDTKAHGPYVLPLTPDPTTQMYGRAGFLVHGDSIIAPGTASFGCMIFNRAVRILLGTSADHRLQVVA
jgi:hypothetical protein